MFARAPPTFPSNGVAGGVLFAGSCGAQREETDSEKEQEKEWRSSLGRLQDSDEQ